jgi:hypothetical protein
MAASLYLRSSPYREAQAIQQCDLHTHDWHKCSHFLATKFCTHKERGDYIISHWHAWSSRKIITNFEAYCLLDVTSWSLVNTYWRFKTATTSFVVEPTTKGSVDSSENKASDPIENNLQIFRLVNFKSSKILIRKPDGKRQAARSRCKWWILKWILNRGSERIWIYSVLEQAGILIGISANNLITFVFKCFAPHRQHRRRDTVQKLVANSHQRIP